MDFTITKKIAKQGKNLVLIIPKNVQSFLRQGDVVQVNFKVLEADNGRSEAAI